MKRKIFNIINSDSGTPSFASKIFDVSIITLIILNVVTIIIDTFDIPEWLNTVMSWIEIVSVIIFTLEYILRIWVADMVYPETSPLKARFKYIFSFMAVIDLYQ